MHMAISFRVPSEQKEGTFNSCDLLPILGAALTEYATQTHTDVATLLAGDWNQILQDIIDKRTAIHLIEYLHKTGISSGQLIDFILRHPELLRMQFDPKSFRDEATHEQEVVLQSSKGETFIAQNDTLYPTCKVCGRITYDDFPVCVHCGEITAAYKRRDDDVIVEDDDVYVTRRDLADAEILLNNFKKVQRV